MRIPRGLKIVITVLAICVVIAFLIWAFLEGRKNLALEQERERPIKAPSRVSIVHGATVITLDPATQKISGIVTAPLAPRFSGGVGGNHVAGALVPDADVVWLDGKAWVYAQRGSEQFIRKEIATDRPSANGWFVEKNVSPGEHVVTQGAQLLLSEEFRSQIQVGED